MHDTERTRSARTLELEELVLREFVEKPEASTRTVSIATNVSHIMAWRMLGAEGLRSYHAQRVHALKATDHQPCVDFFRWFINDWLCNQTLSQTCYSPMYAFSVGKAFSMRTMHTTGRTLTQTLSVLIHINSISASM
ncbi:hypothetical protein TNCV_5027501 [Trichonephila clavipes]|nr:hypothetical protein TNCV_5027501 [Trichonephila clavipes]